MLSAIVRALQSRKRRLLDMEGLIRGSIALALEVLASWVAGQPYDEKDGTDE